MDVFKIEIYKEEFRDVMCQKVFQPALRNFCCRDFLTSSVPFSLHCVKLSDTPWQNWWHRGQGSVILEPITGLWIQLLKQDISVVTVLCHTETTHFVHWTNLSVFLNESHAKVLGLVCGFDDWRFWVGTKGRNVSVSVQCSVRTRLLQAQTSPRVKLSSFAGNQ